MIAWRFWPEKNFSNVYENIYIRTFVADWFAIAETIARELAGRNSLIDIGCGEGHTTKQILDRVPGSYVCDLLEPNQETLSAAQAYLSIENNIGDTYATNLESFRPVKKYDGIFTSHTNYYWADEVRPYDAQLRKLLEMLAENGRVCILTLPEDSDHYKIMVRPVYPDFNHAEYLEKFYRKNGNNVRTIDFKMRFFVGDFFSTQSLYDAKVFYRFIHAEKDMPSNEDTHRFLDKVSRCMQDGYLDFRDRLIIVEK